MSPSSLRTSLTIAAVGCAIRPTNIIIWATLIILYYLDGGETFLSIITTVLPIAYVAVIFALPSLILPIQYPSSRGSGSSRFNLLRSTDVHCLQLPSNQPLLCFPLLRAKSMALLPLAGPANLMCNNTTYGCHERTQQFAWHLWAIRKETGYDSRDHSAGVFYCWAQGVAFHPPPPANPTCPD